VEIICTDEGFKGSYYLDTMAAKINPDKYIIQYDTLLREDELAPLREMVSPAALWPMPSEIPVEKLTVGDNVDVYANDGWWVREVIKKPTYIMFFESNGEEGKYKSCDLRVYQEWIDGQWSTRFKKL